MENLTAYQSQSEEVGVQHALLGEMTACLVVELPDPGLGLHYEVEGLLVQQVERQEAGRRGKRCCRAARGQGGAHRAQAGAHDPLISSGRPAAHLQNEKPIRILGIFLSETQGLKKIRILLG